MRTLILAVIFFVIAVITGVYGFKSGEVGRGKQISKAIFFIFLVLFTVALTFILLAKVFRPTVKVQVEMPSDFLQSN
jgi:uncharacterized membrane protein YtjA (UPF0391 family)